MNIGENIAHTNNATKATIKRTTPIIKIIEKTNPIIAVIIWHITEIMSYMELIIFITIFFNLYITTSLIHFPQMSSQ